MSNLPLHFLAYCGAKVAIRHEVPERYSLGSGAPNNFTYFALKFPNQGAIEDFLVKDSVYWKGAEGLVWERTEGNSTAHQGKEFFLFFNRLKDASFNIERVYGTQSSNYTSVVKYLLGEITLRPLRLHVRELRAQRQFNKRFRFSAERMSILRNLIDWRRNDVALGKSNELSNPFHCMDFFTHLNSVRAWSLPNRDAILGELKFVLDSLVDSGDLYKPEPSRYALSGRALTTISAHELDNRRADAAENNNRKIFLLTVVIAIAAVAQAFSSLWPGPT